MGLSLISKIIIKEVYKSSHSTHNYKMIPESFPTPTKILVKLQSALTYHTRSQKITRN